MARFWVGEVFLRLFHRRRPNDGVNVSVNVPDASTPAERVGLLLRIGAALDWPNYVLRLIMLRRLIGAVTPRERIAVLMLAMATIARSVPMGNRMLPAERWIRIGGVRFLIGIGRGELDGLWQVWLAHAYERHPLFVAQVGWTVVDVGANIGCFSVRQASLGSRVLAVEPGEEARHRLEAAVKANGMDNLVTVLPCALSDTAGTGWLDTRHGTVMGKLMVGPNDAGRRYEASVAKPAVVVQTLDNVLQEAKVEAVQLLKIDAEGEEARILMGAGQSLPLVQRVVVEYHSPQLLAEVRALLQSAGFVEVFQEAVHGGHVYFVRRGLEATGQSSAALMSRGGAS